MRDYCYVWLTKRDGQQEAELWYQYQVMALCIAYHFAIVSMIALILNKAGAPPIPIPITLPVKFIVGILLFYPYFIVFKYLFRKAAKYPIDKTMSAEKFKKLRRKTILIVIIGVVSLVLVLLIAAPPSFD